MADLETEMEMVNRHIAQSERHIREQHIRIARMRETGRPVEVAEELLTAIMMIQAEHRDHMDRLVLKDQTQEPGVPISPL